MQECEEITTKKEELLIECYEIKDEGASEDMDARQNGNFDIRKVSNEEFCSYFFQRA